MDRRVLWGVVAGALSAVPCVRAVSNSISLDFNGSTPGFESSYKPDATGFVMGSGSLSGTLSMQSLPGDIYGDYENDPDSAKNVFFTHLNPLGRTIETTHVHVEDLNANFQGGGIWMGTDEDHYFRVGIINNTFNGGIAAEAVRENEDRWSGSTPPGAGDDIVGGQVGSLASSPQLSAINAVLKIDRIGNSAKAYYSLNNGGTFTQILNTNPGAPTDGSFNALVTSPADSQSGVTGGSNTVEDTFKAGVYAFGGPDGGINATYSFNDFAATSYYAGDANLDGKVNIADLGVLATNYGGSGKAWEQGDFNGDGVVNIADLGVLATNYGSSSLAADMATLGFHGSAIPEPASLSIVGLMGIASLRRARRGA